MYVFSHSVFSYQNTGNVFLGHPLEGQDRDIGCPKKNFSSVQEGKYKEGKRYLGHPVDFLPPRNDKLISFLNHL